MMTFDQILPTVQAVLAPHKALIARIQPVIVNRDLNGRIRLVVSANVEQDADALALWCSIAKTLSEQLGRHAFPPEQMLLFEDDTAAVLADTTAFALEGIEGVKMVDRLATEGRWARIAPLSEDVPGWCFSPSRAVWVVRRHGRIGLVPGPVRQASAGIGPGPGIPGAFIRLVTG